MTLEGVRAVVLAAGRGRRLRPLTDLVPKPLLPVAGKPIVAYTLEQLAAAGCEAAAINLHHRGETIRQRLGGAFRGLRLHYSEEDELLGTLGAFGQLHDFLSGARLVVVVNGDSLARWPIKRLLRRHLKSGAAATLLLARRADPEAFGGAVGTDGKGRIVAIGDRPAGAAAARRRVFAGCHVFAPALVAAAEARESDIVHDLYQPLLERGGHLAAVETGGRWHDLGTPRRYLEGALDLARGRLPARLARRRWVAASAEVGPDARLGQVVIEGGAKIGAGADLKRVLVLPGARVGAGCRVRDAILGPDLALPAGTAVARRLVTAERADVAPRPEDSVVGGLTYTPLEPAAGGEAG